MKRMGSGKKKSSGNGTSTKAKLKPKSGGFVVCINNSEYPASLELFKIYRVLPDSDAAKEGDLRVIDESGEDYLYSADRFIAVELPQRLQASIAKAS